MRRRDAWGMVAASLGLALCLVAPFVMGAYLTRYLTLTFLFIALAQGWNYLGGFGGYISFGNVVFFGLGAYVTAMLMVLGHWPFALAVLVAGAAAGVFGGAVGYPILRLKGNYFTVATFGVAEAVREVVNNLDRWTRGGEGLSLPLMPGAVTTVNLRFYYIALAVGVGSVAVAYALARSRLGYGLVAIREDEDAAETMGVNARRSKVAAYALGGVVTGVAGGVYAYWISYVEPNNVFDVQTSVLMVLIVLLGGPGTVWGPVLGAVLLGLLSETLWSYFLEAHQAILGAAIVLVVLLMPKGVMDLVRGWGRVEMGASLRANLRRYRV